MVIIRYINVESLYCIPETNIRLYANYTKKKVNVLISPVLSIVASKGKRSEGMVGPLTPTPWPGLLQWGLVQKSQQLKR